MRRTISGFLMFDCMCSQGAMAISFFQLDKYLFFRIKSLANVLVKIIDPEVNLAVSILVFGSVRF